MHEVQSASFGERLRRWRLAAGLSQEALAERAGLSPDGVASLERGRRTTPRPATVALLADALGLTPADRSELIAASQPRDGSRAAQAPAAARPPPRSPAPSTPLVGRQRELEELLARLAPGGPARLVTLIGPGGVGKTRLAIEAAARLDRDYRDGAPVVDLAPLRQTDLVAASIARDLGLREEGAQSARDLLLAALGTRETLLVLDNFEQVLGAAPLVAELLAAGPRVSILVTSRAALRLRQEQRILLGGLAMPSPDSAGGLQDLRASPALRLFAERARMVAPDFRLDDATVVSVAAICRRLDGLPLAIELAAARCAVLPPAALLDRLGPMLPLLTGGSVDLPARQQTLRTTLEWSEALLPGPVQALFHRLAVFAGSFTLRAAEAVVARFVDGGHVLDGLQVLVEHSLLTTIPSRGGQPRFALLETVREYAGERLAALGLEQPTRQAHASHYLQLAETARSLLFSGDQIAWLTGLDLEHANLRAALACLLRQPDARPALRLAGALWRFWYIRCYFGEGRRWLEDTLARVPESAPPVETIAVLVGLAVIAYAQTDYERAQAAATRGAALARAAGAQADLAILLNILAGVARNRSDYAPASALGDECVALARHLDDTWTLALSLHNLADVARLQGAFEPAARLAAESLDLARGLADRWAMLQAELVRGWIAHDRGDLQAAAELFERCLPIARDLGDTRDTAVALAGLGKIGLLRRDLAGATSALEESAGLWRQVGDRIRLGQVTLSLGRVAAARGDVAAASRQIRQALEWLAAADARQGVAAAFEALAMLPDAPPRSVVRLAASAAALRAAIGAPIEPVEHAPLERHLAAARVRLGDCAYQAAWEHGRGLPLADALDEALAAHD